MSSSHYHNHFLYLHHCQYHHQTRHNTSSTKRNTSGTQKVRNVYRAKEITGQKKCGSENKFSFQPVQDSCCVEIKILLEIFENANAANLIILPQCNDFNVWTSETSLLYIYLILSNHFHKPQRFNHFIRSRHCLYTKCKISLFGNFNALY